MNLKILIFIVILVSDCRKETLIYNDPFNDSFRSHRIDYMISRLSGNELLSPDTIWFDRRGNMTRIKKFGLNERREYDESNFLKRVLSISDTPSSYAIDYRYDSLGNLIQEWYKISHYNWLYKESDIVGMEKEVIFELQNNRIIKELNPFSDQYTIFNFSEAGIIESKEIFNSNSELPLLKYKYEYNSSNPELLKKIAFYNGQKIIQTHYFSIDGLLDSTVYLLDGHTIEYEYSFIE